MIFRLFILMLIFVTSPCTANKKRCTRIEFVDGRLEKASFYVVGLASLYNTVGQEKKNLYGIINAEAIRFAVREVNKSILPKNFKFGYIIFNDCGFKERDILTEIFLRLTLDGNLGGSRKKQNLTLLKCDCKERNFPIGVVGPDSSPASQHLSEIASSIPVPIGSYYASSVIFKDKTKYGNFFTTVPTDDVYVKFIIDVITRYNWSYVSVIASDDAFGWYGKTELLERFKEHDICVDLDEVFVYSTDASAIRRIFTKVKTGKGKSKVFVIYAASSIAGHALTIASEMELYGMTWILSEATSASEWPTTIDSRVMRGVIAGLFYAGDYTSFENNFWKGSESSSTRFFRNFIRDNPQAWEWARSNQQLFRANMYLTSFIRNTVYTYAYACLDYLKDLKSIKDFKRKVFIENYIRNISSNKLYRAMNNYKGNENSSSAYYKVINFINNTHFNGIGMWSTSNGLRMTREPYWVNGEPVKSKCSEQCSAGHYPVVNVGKKCCWICVLCPHGWTKSRTGNHLCTKCPDGYSNQNRTFCTVFQWRKLTDFTRVYILNGVVCCLFGIISLMFTIVWILKRNHPIVKASDFHLAITQLLIHLIIALTFPIVFFQDVNVFSCITRPLITNSQFVAILSIMGIRAVALVKAFKAKIRITRQDVFVTKSISYGYVVVSVLMNMGVMLLVMSMEGFSYSVRINTVEFTKYHVCNHDGLVTSQFIVLVLLVSVCGGQSFRCRNLPNKFRESECIMSCALYLLFSFCVCAILILSLGSELARLAVIGCIMSVCNGFVVCVMFGSKTHDLLFESSERSRRDFQQERYNVVRKQVDITSKIIKK